MSAEKAAAGIIVKGRVQGVGYRYFTERVAHELGITGWSMNMPDGNVMLDVEGDRDKVESMVEELRKGPGMSRVTDVDVEWKPYKSRYKNFNIRF